MDHILFAIPTTAPLSAREGWRGRVAVRFNGLAYTTRLLRVEPGYRLYAMDHRSDKQSERLA